MCEVFEAVKKWQSCGSIFELDMRRCAFEKVHLCDYFSLEYIVYRLWWLSLATKPEESTLR